MHIRRVLPKDSIQSIDRPTFSRSYYGDDKDNVLVIEPEDGPARAYPILILNYHEIVNDVIDEEPMAITWCPLCGSAVVYERIVKGTELSFGVSGKLADDDLVMYDRETDSEWKQSTGECIGGPLSGTSLTVVPAGMSTYGRFREAFPDGVVLNRPEGEQPVVTPGDDPGEITSVTRDIDYTVDHFSDYVESDWLGSRSREEPRSWNRTDIAAKDVVIGVEADGEAIGILQSQVGDDEVVQLDVGEHSVVVFAADGTLHAFEDPGTSFEPAGDGIFRGDGTTWDGTTGRSLDGRSLDRMPTRRIFAFAWQADHGPDAFHHT